MPRHGRRLSAAAPRRSVRRVAAGCVVVLAGALLAGCGPTHSQADPTHVTTSTQPPAPSPTPTPTPTPSRGLYDAPADAYVKPVRPAILDGKPSEAAAIAFAKYYLRMYTYAYLTGDADGLNKLGKAGCEFCKNVARDIAREYGDGGHDEGGEISVATARAHEYGVDGIYGVWLNALQAPNRELDARGAVVVDNAEAKSDSYEFALKWDAKNGWRVAGLGVTPS